MRLRTRTWLLISVLSFMGAAVFWRLGEQRLKGRSDRTPAATTAPAPAKTSMASTSASLLSAPLPSIASPVPTALRAAVAASTSNATAVAAAPAPGTAAERSALRLRNTTRAVDDLARDPGALLLRNAFIDTTAGTALEIPAHLRAAREAGSYIVQSAGPITPEFRATLEATGAKFVSYLPNNAYVVEATAAQVEQVRGRAGVGAVLPFEPYFKIEPELLGKAVRDEALAPETRLNLTLLPGSREAGLAAIRGLGAEIVGEFRTPFGPAVTITPEAKSLASLARLPEVQGIEVLRRRQLLNDLTRERLGISSGTNVPGTFTNTLGLTGTNVYVNLNDTGVDATHPDLQGRVTADVPSTLIDLEGHGTHTAGTIAGSGKMSSTVSNAPGSALPGADFRGMAPEAELFVLPIDLNTGPLLSDSYLQTTAATNYYITRGGTNLPISNNSWGYVGVYEYSVASASYDAAVRDALPEVTGAQPILYVFSAGNSGAGRDDGQGGEPTTVGAPGTGKNVITVGAIEAPRNITNEVVFPGPDGEPLTNQVFLADTDTDYQVTSFSSRGNVEPGVEGRFGRFKPDVVAPGSYVVSTRSKDWLNPKSFFGAVVERAYDQTVNSGAFNNYSLFVPPQASEFRIRLLPNFRSPTPFPGLPMYLRYGSIPSREDLVNTNNLIRVPPDDTMAEGLWFYTVGNETPDRVSYDILSVITLTNDFGNYFEQLQKINDGVGPWYRYESGTSMSAPAVTGLLALFEDWFQRQGKQPTPALMKALLINGARSLGSVYNFNLSDVINLQGWGLVSLTNTLPADEIGSPTGAVYAIQYSDQVGTNAIVTGQDRTWNVTVGPEGVDQILKVTLVWTDPPGNPNAGVKLVNDLNLIVTNLETGEIFVGNDIPFRSDYNQSHTNLVAATNDVVNNVENVILRPPLGTNYSITVRGHRVNVNAVNDRPTGIAQDFALVTSLENTRLTNVLNITRVATESLANTPTVLFPTNGLPLLSQRVGANPAELGNGLPGATNQWTFLVFTNSLRYTPADVGITNGSNVAFITFLPPNLGKPRERDADIDLYVSTDPKLLQLETNAVGAAFKSRRPGGTELVFFTNAVLDTVYYIGVKAEDQQAAEFSFVALSSNTPFDEDDENGNRIVHGLPRTVPIPDGSPDLPKAGYVFGVATKEFRVQRVIVTNTVAFDSTGDIQGNLSNDGEFSVLFNHALDPTGRGATAYTAIYDDSSSGTAGFGTLIARPTDGPGSLQNFIGTQSTGPWILGVVDNAITQHATNIALNIQLQPSAEDEDAIFATIPPNSALYYYLDVPANATNLIVSLSQLDPPDRNLFLAVRRGDVPTLTEYDKAAVVRAPGGSVTIGKRDVPPLNGGRYYIGIFNQNSVAVSIKLSVVVEVDLSVSSAQAFGLTDAETVVDDARFVSKIYVPEDLRVVDVKVGLRVDHPRVSDLVFRLTSPQGTSILLAENRGGATGSAYGVTTLGNIRTYTTFTEDASLTTTPIKLGTAPFIEKAVVSSSSNRVVFSDGFESAIAQPYLAGQTLPVSWLVTTGQVAVVQVLAGDTNIIEGAQYLTFPAGTESGILTNLALKAGRTYELRFATARVASAGGPQSLTVLLNGAVLTEILSTDNVGGWQRQTVTFPTVQDDNVIEFRTSSSITPLALDDVILREADPIYSAYYLPEETLRTLRGENALGDWKLEVTDTRLGPPGGGITQFDWRLEMIFALPAIEAVQLTNGVPYYGSVSGDDVQYFYVDVPRCATLASNIVAGDFATLLLYGDRDGLPLADLNRFQDDYGPVLNIEPGGLARFVITTNFPAPAPLRPGTRYYLAVRNFQTDLTNNAFGIMVQFDCTDPVLPVVPSLTNNVPVKGTILPGPDLHYYQFNVSSNAIRTDFELVPSGGNVDLYVRRARIPPDPERPNDFALPSPNLFDYLSDDPDPTVTDLVRVERFSSPVNLTPGIWFVAVRNADVVPVNYTLTARESYAPVVNLTNGVAYVSTIAPVDPLIGLTGGDLQYYAFFVASNSVRATFETFGATGNVNLYVRRDLPLPAPSDFQFASQNDGTTDEFIAVNNTDPALWLRPGWWYLAVENADVTNVTYSIRATETPATIIPLTHNVPVTNTIAAGVTPDYYSFVVSPTALSAKFELYGMTDDTQLLLRRGLPVPTFNDFLYSSLNPGVEDEVIELTPFSFPVGLTPGDWYLSVVNASTNPATYIVKASQVTATVTPLTNGVPYNANRPAGPGFDYYSFEVSSNAVAAEFKLTSAGAGDLDLYLRKGPPLPELASAHYVSTNVGNADELIRIVTNSLPVPLSPGLWYLAVTNRQATPVGYEITATEFGLVQPPVSGEITNIVIGATNVCITWISIPGTNYYVVAKSNILDASWTVVTPTITAIDTSTTWCLEPPGPWRFFDIQEGDSPLEPIPAPVPVLSFDGVNICVTWASIAGTNYYVEAKRTLAEADWSVLTPKVTATTNSTTVCYPVDWGYRYFRVGVGEKAAAEPTPLPSDQVSITPSVDRICISWPTRPGVDYLLEAKKAAADLVWTVVSEPIRGDGQPLTQCLNASTGFRFFRVIENASVPPGVPPSFPVVNVSLSQDAAFQLCLTWDTLLGAEYFVQAKQRLADPTWEVISPILTATGPELSYCQSLASTWRYYQIRRVNSTPATDLQIDSIAWTANGPLLRWSAVSGLRFQVFYSDVVPPNWLPAGGPVSSINGVAEFLDNGTVTGGIVGFRLYRIQQLP